MHVSEPPIAGASAGYAVGDVGKFALSADVSGRDIEQDGAIGVTVTSRAREPPIFDRPAGARRASSGSTRR